MKKIITAIGEPYINENLLKEKNLKIVGKDILYLDAIFEIIKNNKIDFLIISELIFENSDILQKINEIKKINSKIKIIIILNKKINIINNIKNKKNIYFIFYNKINKNIIIKKIDKELSKQILEIVKRIIQNTNEKNFFEVNIENDDRKKNKIFYIKIKKALKKFTKKNKKSSKSKKSKKDFTDKNLITIFGGESIGKNAFTRINKKLFQKEFKDKILIIDLDISNQNLYSKFNKRKYSYKIYQRLIKNNYNKDRPNFNNNLNKKISEDIKKYYLDNYEKIFEDFKIKIKNNIYLISGLDLILKNNKKINNKLINCELNKLKNKYKIIIINLNKNNELNLNYFFIKYSKKILIIIKSEIDEIKNIEKLIKNIDNNYKNKINIILNNYNKNSISIDIVKNIFNKIKINKKIKLKKIIN